MYHWKRINDNPFVDNSNLRVYNTTEFLCEYLKITIFFVVRATLKNMSLSERLNASKQHVFSSLSAGIPLL